MFDKQLMKLNGMRAVLMLLTLSALIQAALIIGQVTSLAGVIASLWSGQGVAGQVQPLAVFAACFAGRKLIVLIQDELLARYARSQAAKLKTSLLAKVFDSRSLLSHKVGSASAATSATSGIDDIERYIRIIPPKITGMMALSIPLLVAVFVQHWVSGVILLLAFPVIIFFMIILGRQARANADRQFMSYHRLSNHFIDTLRGIDAVKAFGAAARTADEIFQTSEDLRETTVKTLRVATLSSVVLDLIATFGIAAVAIMLAFGLLDGSIALATALSVIMLAPEYFTPIREFASDYHASLDGKNALAAAFAVINADEGEDRPDVHVPAWEASSTIAAEGVTFSYPDAQAPALDDATFEVSGFAKVGIVGLSGSGKTTLANVLAGFTNPSGGAFLIDGAELETLDVPSWKSQMHYVPQNPYVFNATLRDNVCLYAPGAPDADVQAALAATGLDSLVAELDEGLDTRIGEGSRGLSGGQAQRIALARMLLSDDCRVLVFDEPTAHLDIETEYELKQRMLPLMEGKLVFFATHRAHWLSNMDLVLVMENGRIVEQGTYDELMARQGALTRLLEGSIRGDAA